MKKIFLTLILTFFAINSFADDKDKLSFKDRQEALNALKVLIDEEESIARNFENSLKNFKLLSTVKSNLQIDSTITNDSDKITQELKEFYSSAKYRDRTFVVNDKVYIKIQDDFAKHIFDLLKYLKIDEIKACEIKNNSNTKVVACVHKHQIYINYIQDSDDYIENYDVVYHKEKFKSGPIMINKSENVNKDDESKSFYKIFPDGTIFYDENGVKSVSIKSKLVELK